MRREEWCGTRHPIGPEPQRISELRGGQGRLPTTGSQHWQTAGVMATAKEEGVTQMEERRNDYIYGSQGSLAYPRQPAVARTFTGQQPFAQPRAQASLVPQDTQVLTQNGFKPLSREEREEAARIAEEAGFSFEGYQVVRREFFSHKFDPTLTIKGNSIIFNNACISKLESVVYVQVLVNPTTEKLVIRPCEEGARDSIRWCIVKDDKRKSRQITCGLFTAKLYEMMGWEALYRYKLQGTRINYRGEQLYVFDLTSTEVFLPP